MMARCLGGAAFLFLFGVGAAGCASGAPPYARCGGELGCAGATCIELLYTRIDGTEDGGTFCSDTCTTDADCAALDGATDAACVTLDRDAPLRFFCAPRCVTPADCYAGLSCTETDGAGSLCLPAR
jgi:hypothetical protein